MRVLLFGAGGQVGGELQRTLPTIGEVTALTRQSDDYCGDLQDLVGISRTIDALQPDVIVNAAAYTAVDRAESEPEIARRVNSDAPGVLARAACRTGAWLIHYSTDYVFDGSGSAAWRESDATAPLNIYGASKRAGEIEIANSQCKHLILRTSWVYARRGNNFARTMLRLAQERNELAVIDDQIGVPTGADLVADITASLVRALPQDGAGSGIYHLAPEGETSWYGYAKRVVALARDAGMPLKLGPEDISPIKTREYKTDAQRPLNSRLDTTKLRETWGVELPDWHVGIERLMPHILEVA